MATLLERNILPMFSSIKEIVLDEATVFNSNIFRAVCAKYHITLTFVPPHLHQANLSEGRIRQLVVMLRKFCVYFCDGKDQGIWDQFLTPLCMAINTQVIESTGFTPQQVLLGAEPDNPFDRILKQPLVTDNESGVSYTENNRARELINELVREEINEANLKADKYNDRKFRKPQLEIGQFVKVRVFHLSKAIDNYEAKLDSLYKGKMKLIDFDGSNICILQSVDSPMAKLVRAHAQHVYPYYMPRDILTSSVDSPVHSENEPGSVIVDNPESVPNQVPSEPTVPSISTDVLDNTVPETSIEGHSILDELYPDDHKQRPRRNRQPVQKFQVVHEKRVPKKVAAHVAFDSDLTDFAKDSELKDSFANTVITENIVIAEDLIHL